MEKHVSIARALKEKSRLVGRINILTDVINHQNSLAEGSTRSIDLLVTPTPDDLLRAAERRTSNTRRRRLQDERTRRGDYRKPGWKLMPAYLNGEGRETFRPSPDPIERLLFPPQLKRREPRKTQRKTGMCAAPA